MTSEEFYQYLSARLEEELDISYIYDDNGVKFTYLKLSLFFEINIRKILMDIPIELSVFEGIIIGRKSNKNLFPEQDSVVLNRGRITTAYEFFQNRWRNIEEQKRLDEFSILINVLSNKVDRNLFHVVEDDFGDKCIRIYCRKYSQLNLFRKYIVDLESYKGWKFLIESDTKDSFVFAID
jgi:hypothetical protein